VISKKKEEKIVTVNFLFIFFSQTKLDLRTPFQSSAHPFSLQIFKLAFIGNLIKKNENNLINFFQ